MYGLWMKYILFF